MRFYDKSLLEGVFKRMIWSYVKKNINIYLYIELKCLMYVI